MPGPTFRGGRGEADSEKVTYALPDGGGVSRARNAARARRRAISIPSMVGCEPPMAAAPVVMLASGVAVPQLTSNTTRRVVGQWGGAGGAICEDHLAFYGEFFGFAARAA